MAAPLRHLKLFAEHQEPSAGVVCLRPVLESWVAVNAIASGGEVHAVLALEAQVEAGAIGVELGVARKLHVSILSTRRL